MSYGQYSDRSAGRNNPLRGEYVAPPEGKKRSRQVYPTIEIAHLWAHQTQSAARNPQGNLYFKGDTLYSYRDSFPIARLVTNERGKQGVLITENTCSSTTAGHIAEARRAVSNRTDVFRVWDVYYDHDRNLEHFASEAKEHFEKSGKAIRWGISEFNRAEARVAGAKRYCKFFGIAYPKPLFSFLPTGKKARALLVLYKAKQDKWAAGEYDRDARRKANRDAKRAACEAQWAEQRRLAELALPEKIANWREGKPVYGLPYDTPTMLRVSSKGDEVETSLGARVPIDHARRLLKAVKAVKASGQEWIPNGHTLHVGYYAVNKIEADGTLHAGCHVIGWPEIERIAPKLERSTEPNGEPEQQEEGGGPSDSGSPAL